MALLVQALEASGAGPEMALEEIRRLIGTGKPGARAGIISRPTLCFLSGVVCVPFEREGPPRPADCCLRIISAQHVEISLV